MFGGEVRNTILDQVPNKPVHKAIGGIVFSIFKQGSCFIAIHFIDFGFLDPCETRKFDRKGREEKKG